MFDELSEELLDLRVTERGSPAVGNAFAAFPICTSRPAAIPASSRRRSALATAPPSQRRSPMLSSASAAPWERTPIACSSLRPCSRLSCLRAEHRVPTVQQRLGRSR